MRSILVCSPLVRISVRYFVIGRVFLLLLDMSSNKTDKQWFREENPSFWPGQAFALEIDEVLYHQQSKYQDVLVFKRYTSLLCFKLMTNVRSFILVKPMVMYWF
jgi:hypothetical protein